MTGAIKAREDVKPESARSKTQGSDASIAPKEHDEPAKPQKRKKKKKKKFSSNADVERGLPNSKKTTNHDVEVLPNLPTTSQRKVQVKQRSFASLLDTGSSTVAVDNTEAGVSAPAVDETGVAKGNYGVLLETFRAEQLCISLGLQNRNIEGMFRSFKREEQLGTGEITTGEFFSMMREQPRQLTKGLFEEVGLDRNLRRMRFDDFVICVATVATWSKSELLGYAFRQFDVDESGVMDGRELRAFCEGLKNDSSFYFAKNVDMAREKLVNRDFQRRFHGSSDHNIEANTLLDLEDLAKGSADFQVAFYPLVQFQQNVRGCALGERFWAKVAQRRHDVEVIVHYMRLHKGELPSFSILNRIIAYLMPFSQANAQLVVHKLAILKFAEEERIWQEQAHAEAEKLALERIQEDTQPNPEPPKR
ncbi:hypothetical protein DVH05_009276 [Phytophthora capsici]|nr:hypothetical protein DVH05_009276 [Phytophthora capsici]